MTTESILNFIRIGDSVGTGGQPTQEQFEAARGEGYQAVVNLAPSNAENHALADEDRVVGSLGMAYHHIPVEWASPTLEHFNAFVKTMESLKDKKVLVHCAANFRVTMFYALYATRNEGWSEQQADDLIARIWESRPDYRMDATWKSFLNDVRRSLAVKARP
jgi:protein tyrosine phosphatase (PTP) superfamily phosphohydrolase (DUF442 family)